MFKTASQSCVVQSAVLLSWLHHLVVSCRNVCRLFAVLQPPQSAVQCRAACLLWLCSAGRALKYRKWSFHFSPWRNVGPGALSAHHCLRVLLASRQEEINQRLHLTLSPCWPGAQSSRTIECLGLILIILKLKQAVIATVSVSVTVKCIIWHFRRRRSNIDLVLLCSRCYS